MNNEKFYLTTAIAYTSGKPHIGNTYEAILSDAIARFMRADGRDVFFQTGTDEHGQKIEEKANTAGVSPKEFVDGVAAEIKRIWDLVGVSYDKFIRTTDDYHEKQIQKIFKKLYEQGDIYKGSYEGWYCTPCESFWTESQLVDGKCPDCGRPVQKAREEAYFFKMSKYADRLMKYYDEHPEFIAPLSRKNEMVNNFLKPGLQDLCVSRTSFKWGIPVDFDSKHVVYVWLDALSNYITGIGYDADGNSTERFNKYWPADAHIIGKDIIRFHTIYWPIFLMALGLPLPNKVYGHGWLLQDGGKMSKSKGNVIYADDAVEYFGKDAVRYFVLTAMPFDNDGLVSWQLMIDKINSDLANVFGNLVSRTAAMSNKYFGGAVEKGNTDDTEVDLDLIATAKAVFGEFSKLMKEFKVSDAIECVMGLFRRANKYIDETTPWILAKDAAQAERLKRVLYNLTESIIIGVSCLAPVIPDTCDKVAEIFGTSLRGFDELGEFGLIDTLKVMENPQMLFARLDGVKTMEIIEKSQIEKYGAPEAEAVEPECKVEAKPTIEFPDFEKLQLRVAKVIDCVKVEKSKKLLKLTVKLGQETRTVVSGIAAYYKPEDLIGKKLVMIANLKPVKLCGIESQGMIICAEDANGIVSYLTPENLGVLDGSECF